MPVLSEHAVFIFVAQLGVILLAARLFGELAERLGQPVIVGEVVAGIILGPSIFGMVFPELRHSLFPSEGYQPYILQGLSWLCVLFLLMITGLEIDFRASFRQGNQSILISLLSLTLSFLGTYLVLQFVPDYIYPPGVERLHVQLLGSIALAVVAIPVIAKILFDLKILRSEVGVNVLTSGVLSDVWGWTILAVIISLIAQGTLTIATILKPLFIMAAYLLFTLTVGHKIVDKCFEWFGYKENHGKADITSTLTILFSLTLLNGAIAHLLHVHVIFGAFIAGIMAGESAKITPYLRQWTQDFIFAIFAPIFFVLIGMQLQLPALSAWGPILILLVVSSVFRIIGAYIGGIWGGLGQKNALAVACGLNTQGTMGIVIALIGYDMGVFNDSLFSAIIIICILTSLLVGPLLKWAMKGVKRPLAQFFDRQHAFLDIEGKNKKEVIQSLSAAMQERRIIKSKEEIEQAIWDRESMLSTAIGEGVALPHARIPNLKDPILCFFRLKTPIDFGSPDDKPVQLLFLELTDNDDDGMHLNLIAQVARFISSDKNRKRLLECKDEEQIHHILSFDEKA